MTLDEAAELREAVRRYFEADDAYTMAIGGNYSEIASLDEEEDAYLTARVALRRLVGMDEG